MQGVQPSATRWIAIAKERRPGARFNLGLNRFARIFLYGQRVFRWGKT